MTEAEALGKYLLGKAANEKSISLYNDAMLRLNIVLNTKEERLLRFMIKNNWAIGLVDSGIAMFRKKSGIRNKILVMNAILETIPEYSDLFFPKRTSMLYVSWVGLRAGAKSLIGGLLIKFF